jgi:hypothetical protein
VCPPDETIEDPQPDTTPDIYQPPSNGNGEPSNGESKFPIVPVAAGVGAVVLLAALAG